MFCVLIDTSAYEALRLSFSGDIFDSLKKLSDEQKVVIVGSDILRREMEVHLSESIKQSVNRLDKVSRDLDRLTRDDLGEFTRILHDLPLLKERIFESRKRRMDNYFSELYYEELDKKQININNVIDDYFSMKPPFGDGNKKAEFPDAFVLNAFINTYHGNLRRTCLVSEDEDWEKFVRSYPEIHFFKKISELIDFIHTSYDEVFTTQLKKVLLEKTDQVAFDIKVEVRDGTFNVDDSWIDAEEELDTDSVVVEVLDFNIISFGREAAQVEVETKVSYDLNVWAKDELACYKDSDTKEWVFLGTNQYSVAVEKQIAINLTVSYNSHPNEFEDTLEVGEVVPPDDLFYVDSDEFKFELVKHWNEDDD